MSNLNVRLSIKELRKIISEVIQEAPPPIGTIGEPISKKKPTDRSKKDPTDQRKVVDAVRNAISDAITDDVRKKVHSHLNSINVVKYSDIEIISEPPKTLIRLKGVGGEAGQDMIYLINVTKIV